MKEENTSNFPNEFISEGFVTGPNGLEDALPAAVIDTSFFAAFLLGTADECYDEAKSVIGKIVEQGGIIFVPPLFWYEIGNVLLNSSRPRKDGSVPRITLADSNDILYDLKQLPIATRDELDLEIMMRIQDLARTHSLTLYDASYLELSRRLSLPLYTFDTALREVVGDAKDLEIAETRWENYESGKEKSIPAEEVYKKLGI